MNTNASIEQLKGLAAYLDKVADEIPLGLTDLKDAVSFACIDLKMAAYQNTKGPNFSKALAFARSIPRVDDLKDDILVSWMLHDEEFLKYWPL